MGNIVAIVVTYNRKKLLRENISALLNQKEVELSILIVDNASTDGTKQMIEAMEDKRIIYENTKANLGGSGGFSYGIKKACEMGFHYGWIMDDDSMPCETALVQLLQFAENHKFSFLASTVYWTDGNLFPMNKPAIVSPNDETIEIIKKNNVMPISSCSFVGCFVDLYIAREVGLPISQFFIYGDDLEYTLRLHTKAPAYWVLNSDIIHKAPSNIGADVATASADRIDRFYYQTRNGGYIARMLGTSKARFDYIKRTIQRINRIVKVAPDKKLKRIFIVLKGLIAGIFFKPQIQYPE